MIECFICTFKRTKWLNLRSQFTCALYDCGTNFCCIFYSFIRGGSGGGGGVIAMGSRVVVWLDTTHTHASLVVDYIRPLRRRRRRRRRRLTRRIDRCHQHRQTDSHVCASLSLSLSPPPPPRYNTTSHRHVLLPTLQTHSRTTWLSPTPCTRHNVGQERTL